MVRDRESGGSREEEKALLRTTTDEDWDPELTDMESVPASDVEQDALRRRSRWQKLGWLAPLTLGAVALTSGWHSVGPADNTEGSRRRNSGSATSSGGIMKLSEGCHTAVAGEECHKAITWAKTEGIHSNPEWYPDLTVNSTLGEFQVKLHNNTPDQCPQPCKGGNPDKQPCAPHLVEDEYGLCNEATGPLSMTFYMYRAQGVEDYPIENVNLASLPGVMWYLHNEVVGSQPRKFEITRLIRYKVTIKNTVAYFRDMHKQFGPFVAFDKGSARNREDVWEKYGYVVGCQVVDPDQFNFQFKYKPSEEEQPECEPKDTPVCNSGKWYSLPGPCPAKFVENKTAECISEWPGGHCPSADVTGEKDCTYWSEFAGQIQLDELEGIEDYESWWLTKDSRGGVIPSDNIEYSRHLDKGIGMDFWDHGHDVDACTNRMNKVKALFKEKFPDYPEWLPEPPCI